ncbi:M48 family metallopeptidase [Phascolarctobacterium succinatutens]|uniref:M48 family metallopeptidase n=1 Tax=Phascolarctobacterium succinatutens TaxID=626940 RepID=UPI0026EDAC38|nr:SprT family zinc-dependent metalloprotease [Phascolarctobacterium succinatutens]
MSTRIIRRTVLNLHGLTINLQFKLVKNITLRIKETGDIFLTAPIGMSVSEVQRFLESREQWLCQKLQLVLQEQLQQKQEKKYSMGELPFDGQHVWLWGKRLPAHFLLSGKKHGTYEVQADAVNFYYRSELNNEAKCAFVELFYKQELAGRGEQLLQAWEKKMGVRHTGLKVHRMKTRWGSCNVRTGSINLNTLLACWPQECLEYIVVHELTHLHEANHSPHFHAIVERYLPEWRERKKMLAAFKPL